jgi:YebC/PmpR family DNA-binding regulatory protein
MSGHNKWSKIKHKKAATDAEKSKIFSKHAAVITMESRRAKGDTTDPGLIAAIDRAKRDSMPKDNIERAVAKGAGATGNALEEVVFEGFGPGGTAIIVTAITDNNNRTAPLIRQVFTKAGYALGTPGTAAWAFTREINNYTPLNLIELNKDDTTALGNLITALLDLDDVQTVFTTASVYQE